MHFRYEPPAGDLEYSVSINTHKNKEQIKREYQQELSFEKTQYYRLLADLDNEEKEFNTRFRCVQVAKSKT